MRRVHRVIDDGRQFYEDLLARDDGVRLVRARATFANGRLLLDGKDAGLDGVPTVLAVGAAPAAPPIAGRDLRAVPDQRLAAPPARPAAVARHRRRRPDRGRVRAGHAASRRAGDARDARGGAAARRGARGAPPGRAGADRGGRRARHRRDRRGRCRRRSTASGCRGTAATPRSSTCCSRPGGSPPSPACTRGGGHRARYGRDRRQRLAWRPRRPATGRSATPSAASTAASSSRTRRPSTGRRRPRTSSAAPPTGRLRRDAARHVHRPRGRRRRLHGGGGARARRTTSTST